MPEIKVVNGFWIEGLFRIFLWVKDQQRMHKDQNGCFPFFHLHNDKEKW
jgi:hypothetical protein